MSFKIKLFVVDTGPLITLAVANSLDYLLYVQADIVIPDAVLYEATYDAAKLGAQDIIDWLKANRMRIAGLRRRDDERSKPPLLQGTDGRAAEAASPVGFPAYPQSYPQSLR
jgi:hypothetical protein